MVDSNAALRARLLIGLQIVYNSFSPFDPSHRAQLNTAPSSRKFLLSDVHIWAMANYGVETSLLNACITSFECTSEKIGFAVLMIGAILYGASTLASICTCSPYLPCP